MGSKKNFLPPLLEFSPTKLVRKSFRISNPPGFINLAGFMRLVAVCGDANRGQKTEITVMIETIWVVCKKKLPHHYDEEV